MIQKIAPYLIGHLFYATPAEMLAVVPPGQKLAVYQPPFSKKFAITWWVPNGR